MTGVRVREGRSSSVFAFAEGGKGYRDAVVVSFFDPFARSLHFWPILSWKSRRRRNFRLLPLGGLEVLSSVFGHPPLAIYKNMVIVSLHVATPIPYIWTWWWIIQPENVWGRSRLQFEGLALCATFIYTTFMGHIWPYLSLIHIWRCRRIRRCRSRWSPYH